MSKKDEEEKLQKMTPLYLGEVGAAMEKYADSDPRFRSRSECARHLISKGMRADKKEREKAISSIKE